MLSLVALMLAQHPTIGRWTLRTGTAVSVVMLEPAQKLAWRPDGSKVSFESLPKWMGPVLPDTQTDLALVVFTNSKGRAGEGPTVKFKLPSAPITDSVFSKVAAQGGISLSGMMLPKEQPSPQNVAVGIADAPWKVKGWVGFQKKGRYVVERIRRGVEFSPTLSKSDTTDRSTDSSGKQSPLAITVVLPDTLKDVAVRIVARKFGDKVMEPAAVARANADRGSRTYYFNGDSSDLMRIELQTRPFEWTTVWGAHFRPAP